jgi:hypothetical protein
MPPPPPPHPLIASLLHPHPDEVLDAYTLDVYPINTVRKSLSADGE